MRCPRVQHEFALELKVNAALRHPRIVNFLGAVAHFPKSTEPVNSWSLGLVLELCDGGEINELLHVRKVKFSMQEKLGIVADTAKGVAYLASQCVVHRDLSSRNLLLTGTGRTKIADYGCARILPEGRSYQPSFISGSPPWVCPIRRRYQLVAGRMQ
jgi:serine/threonine protein kinase